MEPGLLVATWTHSLLLMNLRSNILFDLIKNICSSSDEPTMMAGLGTVGLEIITQLPEADAVIVPVASGALLASVLVACKKLKCTCLVYVSIFYLLCSISIGKCDDI